MGVSVEPISLPNTDLRSRAVTPPFLNISNHVGFLCDLCNDAARGVDSAIARNLLKAEGVAVIILGGGHDLTDNIKRVGGN